MTAVEVMISISILSMAGICLVAILIQSLAGWSSGTSRDTSTGQATIALQRLSNDIRDGKSASVSNGVLTVVFPLALQDATTGERIYDLSSDDPTPRHYYTTGSDLVRSVGGTTSIIGRGVSAATFAAGGGAVTVSLTSSEQVGKCVSTQQVTGRVALRNYQD
jgi:hypothetical protein